MLPIQSFSQVLDDYKNILTDKNLTVTFTTMVGKNITDTKYAGQILDSRRTVKYYIVNENHKPVNKRKETSKILVFNSLKILIAEVKLSNSSELPFYIKDNKMHFDYLQGGKHQTYVVPFSSMPKEICTKPKSCYAVKIL